MFTDFLDAPAPVFFLLLFVWYVLYLKGGCVTYFFLMCVQCATQILLKKTPKNQKQPFSLYTGVEKTQSVSQKSEVLWADVGQN